MIALLLVALAATPIVDARFGYQLTPGPFQRVETPAPPPELLGLFRGPRGEVAVLTRTEGPSPEDPAAAVASIDAALATLPGFRRLSSRRLAWGPRGDQLHGYEVSYRTGATAVVARWLFYPRSVVSVAVETRGRAPSAAARALVRSFTRPPRS